ncbi:MAG: 30S ribosomal protein S12 methylthiotransferase RimO [Propionibacteriales bacterium]|nr:30S ribosomal protein S12 methylthiotransferase RimO [Propionibacteriales bacterium]
MPVHLISLGCARNEVDSEELAGRLAADGFTLVDDPDAAQAIVVNTCGFIDAAKKDSVDTLLAAADHKAGGVTKAVVAVGCLAERYGAELAEALPEADAVLSFDDYPDIAARLTAILGGERPAAHERRDRRSLLPLTPVARPAGAVGLSVPGHAGAAPGPASGPRVLRQRLGTGPSAPLKIASGCDRRCAFCAIPSFRGSYLSRPVGEVVAEARWLVESGVREVVLVSENSTGYGRDLSTNLETLITELNGVDGLDWIRVSYLQPAEIHPALLHAMLDLPRVVPYFDVPFQHATESLLRKMRRFGNPESFLDLLARIRAVRPDAGIRSNVILGFPGETADMVDELAEFLAEARLDAVGVFGYSDEEGTEGERLRPKVDVDEIDARVDRISSLVEAVSADRAADRIGERVQVLVEGHDEAGRAVGRAAQQGPETDGMTTLEANGSTPAVGALVWSIVSGADGVDLVAEVES